MHEKGGLARKSVKEKKIAFVLTEIYFTRRKTLLTPYDTEFTAIENTLAKETARLSLKCGLVGSFSFVA